MTALRQLIEELHRLAPTRADAKQIAPGQGELLRQIALTTNARVIIEIGTSYGFSGLFWGEALLQTGGVLHTIDADPMKVESARKTFAAAGLGTIVTAHLGKAADVLATMNGPFDIAFLDADKSAERGYFEMLWPKIRPGGSILTDNVSTHREELADFLNYVRSLENASSREIPLGNGLEWTVKIAKK